MANRVPLYFVCYDIGYGERGVREGYMLADEVIEWLSTHVSPERAGHWLSENKPDWFEANQEISVIHENLFNEEHWKPTY